MRTALVRLNAAWRDRGLPELRAGRLRELTKVYGFNLLVGENVAKLLIEEFDLRPLGLTKIRDRGEMEVVAVIENIQPVAELQETASRGRLD